MCLTDYLDLTAHTKLEIFSPLLCKIKFDLLDINRNLSERACCWRNLTANKYDCKSIMSIFIGADDANWARYFCLCGALYRLTKRCYCVTSYCIINCHAYMTSKNKKHLIFRRLIRYMWNQGRLFVSVTWNFCCWLW